MRGAVSGPLPVLCLSTLRRRQGPGHCRGERVVRAARDLIGLSRFAAVSSAVATAVALGDNTAG